MIICFLINYTDNIISKKSMQGLNNSLDPSEITIRYEDLVAGKDLKHII